LSTRTGWPRLSEGACFDEARHVVVPSTRGERDDEPDGLVRIGLSESRIFEESRGKSGEERGEDVTIHSGEC
jgi:hypothetical protein